MWHFFCAAKCPFFMENTIPHYLLFHMQVTQTTKVCDNIFFSFSKGSFSLNPDQLATQGRHWSGSHPSIHPPNPHTKKVVSLRRIWKFSNIRKVNFLFLFFEQVKYVERFKMRRLIDYQDSTSEADQPDGSFFSLCLSL